MSNGFQIFEGFSILLIIGFQVYIFISTGKNINIFKSIFPDIENFKITKIKLLPELARIHPKEILSNLDKYIEKSKPKIIEIEVITPEGYLIRPAKYEEDSRIEIDLIECKSGANAVTLNICNSLNTYLIRNKGVAADFHLIKDVVERNVDAREDGINQTISLPLYLGLLGTFIGIVIGLIQMSGVDFSGDPKILDNAISSLLSGVMIAMIASFAGLLLTIINTGYSFKGAKSIVEDRKNDFYTFIQTELLPLLNQNINSTLYSLQNNLHKFNEEFKTNVTGLSGIMGKNHDALIAQEKILTTLDNMDITEFAKANVKILKELQLSTEKFAQFNQYLGSMNTFVSTTNGLTGKVNEMIERTDNFNTLGNHIISTFEENKTLIKFLQSHYSELEQSRQLITSSVYEVNKTLDGSLDQLKLFTQERINELQKITLRELDLMENQYPEKWKKLDNLTYLEILSKNLGEMKTTNNSQINSLKSEIESLNKKLNKAVTSLDAINLNTNRHIYDDIVKFFKKLFTKKVAK